MARGHPGVARSRPTAARHLRRACSGCYEGSTRGTGVARASASFRPLHAADRWNRQSEGAARRMEHARDAQALVAPRRCACAKPASTSRTPTPAPVRCRDGGVNRIRRAIRGCRRAGSGDGPAVPSREVRRHWPPHPGQLPPPRSDTFPACRLNHAGQAHHRVPRRPRRRRSSRACSFEDLRHAGDPAALARRYNAEGIDELVILDVTATIEKPPRAGRRRSRAVAAELVHPLCRRRRHPLEADDAAAVVDAGADKVAPEHARRSPDRDLIRRLAASYGSQAVIVAIDAKREGDRYGGLRSQRDDGDGGAMRWSGRSEAESRGAGEILLTSIDRDGTQRRVRLRDDRRRLSGACSIPVIASGGAGTFDALRGRVHARPRRRCAGCVDLSLHRARRGRPESAPATAPHPHARSL